jgi:hypothetical protein
MLRRAVLILDAAERIKPHAVEVAFARFKCHLLAKNETCAIAALGALATATGVDNYSDVLRVRNTYTLFGLATFKSYFINYFIFILVLCSWHAARLWMQD